jgi:ribose transport system substrate-binding protein
VSSVEDRATGFQEVIAQYPDMEFVGMEYCTDDPNIAAEQVSAVLQREPELAGIFALNTFSALGAGNAVKAAGLQGAVQIVLYDATIDAMNNLKDDVVTMVLAQKPYDMGYLGVEFALADWRGVTSLPKHLTTGFAILNKANMDDPEYARFIYQVP